MKRKLLVTLLTISIVGTMLTGCLPKPRGYDSQDYTTEEQGAELEDEVSESSDTETDIENDKEEVDLLLEEGDATEQNTEVENEAEETEENTAKPATTTVSDELSDNWSDMQFQLNGQVFTIPCDYSAIQALGYSFDLSEYGYENGYILNPGDSTYSTITLKNAEGAELSVGFKNTGDTAKDITECQLWAIGTDIAYADAAPDLVFPGGITWGSTLEEVEAVYGTLNEEDIYTSDLGYKAYYYIDEVDSNKQMDVNIYTNDPDGELEGVKRLEMKFY